MHLEVKRNVNLIPCGEGFTWKDSCAFKVEESLTPSTYRERFVGEIALHVRWKNFKIDCSLPTISNRWGRIALYLGRDYQFEHTKFLIIYFQMDDLWVSYM